MVICSPSGEYLVECDTVPSGNLLQNNNTAGIRPSPEFDPWTVQLVARRYTDWTIPTIVYL
jgi:hypothetical protein